MKTWRYDDMAANTLAPFSLPFRRLFAISHFRLYSDIPKDASAEPRR